ncbi:MAG: hypothetical protein WC383_15365 [Gammaproteobacteria bacterium]
MGSDYYGTRKTVKVPVKWVDSRWEFFYGGVLPVQEGAIAELKIDLAAITDEIWRQRLTAQHVFKVLDEGATLLVALSDRSTTKWDSFSLRHFPTGFPPGTTRWEKIRLGPVKKKDRQRSASADGTSQNAGEPGGLWLRITGLDRCELVSSTILMPEGFPEREASSLNHAFTLLSKAYEKHRISNTGNVYTRVFYQDRDQCWYPLDDLRSGVQAKVERALLNELWADIEKKLGWRPAPPPQRRGRTGGV